jgi:hypothetical protein
VNFDIQDVLADGLGSVFVRFLLFIVAAWLGCTLGAAAILAGQFEQTRVCGIGFSGFWIWASPLLLLSSWALLNVPFLLFFLARFIREDGDDFLTIGLVIGVQSLAVMAGWAHDFVQGWAPRAIAWSAWLIIVAMLGTGLWFARQAVTRAQLRNMARLHEENDRLRKLKIDEERAQMSLEDER